MKKAFILYMVPWFEPYTPGHLMFQHEAEALEFAMSCWEEYLYHRFHEELWFAMDRPCVFPPQSSIGFALRQVDRASRDVVPFVAGPVTCVD